MCFDTALNCFGDLDLKLTQAHFWRILACSSVESFNSLTAEHHCTVHCLVYIVYKLPSGMCTGPLWFQLAYVIQPHIDWKNKQVVFSQFHISYLLRVHVSIWLLHSAVIRLVSPYGWVTGSLYTHFYQEPHTKCEISELLKAIVPCS